MKNKDENSPKKDSSKVPKKIETEARNRTINMIYTNGKEFAYELMGRSYVDSLLSGRI